MHFFCFIPPNLAAKYEYLPIEIDHFHDNDIWLQLSEFISFLLSYSNLSGNLAEDLKNSPFLHKTSL